MPCSSVFQKSLKVLDICTYVEKKPKMKPNNSNQLIKQKSFYLPLSKSNIEYYFRMAIAESFIST